MMIIRWIMGLLAAVVFAGCATATKPPAARAPQPLIATAGVYAVQPDTIYQVDLRMACTNHAPTWLQMIELNAAGHTNATHSLAVRPGYLLMPPDAQDETSYFATTRQAAQAYLTNLVPYRVESVAVRAIGRVEYPAQSSANFVWNAACERADEHGVAKDYGRWGGPAPDVPVVAGAGRNGSAALQFKQGTYLLGCGEVTAMPGRRYRLGAWFRGVGEVSFELRGATKGYESLFLGINSLKTTVTPEWRFISYETVALPQQDRFAALIVVMPAAGQSIWVDDVEAVELGRDQAPARP